MSLLIGVMALQGDFAKHIAMIQLLGIKVKEVRRPQDLQDCDGLILPGGESTTMSHQLDFIQLAQPLHEFAQEKPIFGTCAGLILMSKEIMAHSMKPFGFLNIVVERNAYGRQVESFLTQIEVKLEQRTSKIIPAVFIRAPRIRSCGDGVKILGTFQEEPVLVEEGFHLAATFHPELTQDCSIHRHFLSLVKKASKS